MSEKNSILDKVIESKHIQDASQFNPGEFVSTLLKNLPLKEREIITRRFGLAGQDKQTLEQIGKSYDITRERIRQIQALAVKKLKQLEDFKTQIETIESTIIHLLEEHGGLMEENHFLEKILSFSENNPTNRQATSFIASYLLDDKIKSVKTNTHLLPSWRLNAKSLDSVTEVLKQLVNLIEERNKLLAEKELIDLFKKSSQIEFEFSLEQIDKVINSYLRASKKIEQNILGEWGLASWQTIVPKRMGDKIYLVLRKEEKPLHFTEIADLINQYQFDKKVAHPATIHNELILDPRYVLVGRGIYALKDWGYNPGTVSDVIANILQNSNEPLTKEEIIKKVLEQRMVKKTTINLALADKNKFKKNSEGKYILV